MSKPLELTVYEKEPGLYGREPRYHSPDGFWAYPESHVDGYAAEKRFTDAELAAEVWRQEAQVTTVEAMGGTPVRNIGALKTLHRFATLPHFDEVSL